jgi:hypothetical protein
MFDEMFEGGGYPWIMTINLCDIAHFFVLQNVELMHNNTFWDL